MTPCNPYEDILFNDYGDECDWNDVHGMDAAVVLVLCIMADNYKGDMPEGGTCCDTIKWCFAQLSKYKPNDVIDRIERDWAQAVPDFYD